MATAPYPVALSLHSTTPRRSLLPSTKFNLSYFFKPQQAQPNFHSTFTFPTFSSISVKASDFDEIVLENEDPDEKTPFIRPEAPSGYVRQPYFDEYPMETEEEIEAAYEERYGPAFSGVSYFGNDVNEMDAVLKAEEIDKDEKIRDGFEERVVQVRRVTKVVKGGKNLNFRAIVVVGDMNGRVGVGVGKAQEVVSAVQKSALNARRNIITVPMTKYKTFPHRADGKFGAAKVMLRPACPGTGVIAGGSVRVVLEMAGIENALGKQLGSNNALNNARAVIVAVQKMRTFEEVAADREIPVEHLYR